MKKYFTSFMLSVLIATCSRVQAVPHNLDTLEGFKCALNETDGLRPSAAKAFYVFKKDILESSERISAKKLTMTFVPYALCKKELASHIEKLKKEKKITGENIEILDSIFGSNTNKAFSFRRFAKSVGETNRLMKNIAIKINILKGM